MHIGTEGAVGIDHGATTNPQTAHDGLLLKVVGMNGRDIMLKCGRSGPFGIDPRRVVGVRVPVAVHWR